MSSPSRGGSSRLPKEKVLGAVRAGVKEIILPIDNEADLDDIPQDVRDQVVFHLAETLDDVIAVALQGGAGGSPTKRGKSAGSSGGETVGDSGSGKSATKKPAKKKATVKTAAKKKASKKSTSKKATSSGERSVARG